MAGRVGLQELANLKKRTNNVLSYWYDKRSDVTSVAYKEKFILT
jgi:hypothetical protein